MISVRRFGRSVSAAVLAAALCGCGPKALTPDYSSLGLTEVTGRVTLDGEPVEGATVTMTDPETFGGSVGETDLNGVYRMRYNSEQAGVLPGVKAVRISTADAGPDRPPGLERIPARYNAKSDLTATVEPDGKQVIDFALTSGDEVVQPSFGRGDR